MRVVAFLGVAAALVAIGVARRSHTQPQAQPPLPASTRALARACNGAAMEPAADTTKAAHATLCLLNLERHRHRLEPLHEDAALDRAALAHAADMVAREYFAHRAPDGTGPVERIVCAGYADARLTGENLAWGDGIEASPAAIVDGWMHSPGHRANILRADFEEIGIGIVPRPIKTSHPDSGATYDTTFGAPRH